jgi:hypothetical protein
VTRAAAGATRSARARAHAKSSTGAAAAVLGRSAGVPTCPTNPEHGALYAWRSERWGWWCAHSAHGGNGKFFTTADLDVARPVLTGAQDDALAGSGAGESAGTTVLGDREALLARSGLEAPQALAASVDPIRRAGGRSLDGTLGL